MAADYTFWGDHWLSLFSYGIIIMAIAAFVLMVIGHEERP